MSRQNVWSRMKGRVSSWALLATVLLASLPAQANTAHDLADCVLGYIQRTLQETADTGKYLSQHGYLELPTGRTVFYDFEPPRGLSPNGQEKPTVVLVHGLSEDLRSWNEVARRLVERGYGVVRMDLHGHGHTLATDLKKGGLPNTINSTQNVEDLIALLKHLKRDRVYLTGHSMGGGIAAETSVHPDRSFQLLGLNLNATYTFRLDSARAQAPQLSLLEDMINQFIPKILVDTAMDRMVIDSFSFDAFRPHIEHRFRELGKIPEGQALTDIQKQWVDQVTHGAIAVMKGMRQVDLHRSLANNLPKDVPVTINMGAKDSLVPNHMHDSLSTALKARGYDVTLNKLEGVGHGIPQQAPDAIVDSILKDLEGK